MVELIDSRQLRAFVRLAECASFTRAAKELHLSQSAVSHSIKAIEADVGCRLFDRVGKKVLLTQAGEQLLHHAQRIITEMGAARASLKQLGKWGRGRLRIAASTTACQYILPSVFRELKSALPETEIILEPCDMAEATDLLRANRVDLGLVLESRLEDTFEFRALFSDEMRFIVSPSHPWAVAGHATKQEISRQQYIQYGKASFTFRAVERYFRGEDIILNTVMELGSVEAIKEMVKLGLGVTVLAPWVARRELDEGSLVALPLGRRKLARTWGVLLWKGRRGSLAEERFINLCRDAGNRLVEGIKGNASTPASPGPQS